VNRFSLFVIYIFPIALNQTGMAQPSRFDFFLGYGYYEGITAGSELFNKSGLQSLSLSVGYFRSFQKDEETFSATLGYQHAVFLKQHSGLSGYKWHLGCRAVFWRLEDPFYLWKAVSIIPSINRSFLIFDKVRLNLDAGPAFNIVLFNKRKTYEQVGWPYHVMPEIRIIWIL
jgi:hypothetical protein